MLAARADIDRIPYLFLCLWLRIVGISFARYFNTNEVIKPGNIVKLPLSIALSYMLFTGKKHIACKN